MTMLTTFSPSLVVTSILVAMFASYVALTLAQSVTRASGRARAAWLAAGAFAMGIGIWSMHFIGMLAFEMPGMAMAYDVPSMVLSIVVAVGASALAFYLTSLPAVPPGSIVSGGVAMATAIAGMHYIGMNSMRMAASIRWNTYLVVASMVIALVASVGALVILNRLRNKADHWKEMLLAAIVMGLAVSGMHYTGMIAATFVHKPHTAIEPSHLLVSLGLELAVITTTLMILVLALGSALVQKLLAKRNAETKAILGKNEECFRKLVEAVKDYAILMVDPEGRITTWNAGAERIMGYTEEQAIGQHLTIFVPADHVPEVSRELELARTLGHFQGESPHVRRDGTIYWANIVISPLYDEKGRLTGYSKVLRDVTEARQAAAAMQRLNDELEQRVKSRTLALEARERQLRTITDAVPVLLCQVDRDVRITFANQAFCDWFDTTHDEIIGQRFEDLLGPKAYPFNEPHIKKAMAGEIATYERESDRGHRKDHLNITFLPERDQSGEVTGFVLVAANVSAYKNVQAELKRAKEAAEVANETKSAFLANMSHEIRTPLGVVLGYSELLADGDLTPSERLNTIQVIKRNGKLLSNVINDILDISKVEAGKLDVERVEVPFAEVMNDVATTLDLEASERGIELKIVADSLVPARIKTDPLRLRQILFNIIGNAIKFTRRGSVTVKIRMSTDSAGASRLAFFVTDTGEGIQPEQAARLFKPFTQADVSMTRRFGGTGLGLVLAKRLAKALGGDVELLETTPGKGSTFVVTIDPGLPETVIFQRSEVRPPAEKPKPFVVRPTTLNSLKVLVVDDSLDNQLLLKRILKRAGASVETANNGREAIEKALEVSPSVILMDLQMPEMDGYEATRTLRGQGYQRPILALTAHAMKEERQRPLRSGFDGHITKPVDHDALIRSLASYIN